MGMRNYACSGFTVPFIKVAQKLGIEKEYNQALSEIGGYEIYRCISWGDEIDKCKSLDIVIQKLNNFYGGYYDVFYVTEEETELEPNTLYLILDRESIYKSELTPLGKKLKEMDIFPNYSYWVYWG